MLQRDGLQSQRAPELDAEGVVVESFAARVVGGGSV